MACCTDYLRLNDQKVFKTISETLPKGIVKTENILTVKDDVLFVWNFQDSCVLTFNLKAAKTKQKGNVNYQILSPTNGLLFSPELLVVNESCELLAVAGPMGILVMVLPRRGPPHGSFAGSKEFVYCKSYLLDEQLFAYNKIVEVRQVRWHPGSKMDNHLLVLASDNMFRLYTIQHSGATLIKIYQIGTQPMGILPGTRLPFLAGLGETGVDFDFGAPEANDLNGKGKWDDLDWPIYILRGDGEVFTLVIDINEKKKPILKGPLAISVDDNYRSDACSIMCFKTTPPVIAISTCTGTIYHCVVLKPIDDSEFGGSKTVVQHSNYSLYPADKVLYVSERVELELGLAVTDSDNAYSCPIFLHPDDSNKGRYFCTHETGVHVVNVPLISELDSILESSDDDLNICLPNLNNQSIAEYLLCTHATGAAKVNPVLGFSLCHCPTTMIALLATGQVVSLPLVSAMILPHADQLYMYSDSLTSPLKKMLEEPFDAYIRKSLQTTMNQPIIKLSKDSNLSVEECAQLVSRATQTFREEHIKKYDKIREDIEKRVKTLQMLKDHQINELKKINVTKQNMQENAEKLAEKYEDIKDKQEELTKRCEKLLILVTQKQPKPTESEKTLFKELKSAENKISLYAKAIDHVRSKQKYQEIQMANWMKQEKKKEITLGSTQTTVIKNNLSEMATNIAEMSKEIQIYKQELNLK